MVAASEFAWSKTPRKVEQTAKAKFMFHTGTLKSEPASWKDLSMPEVHGLAGGLTRNRARGAATGWPVAVHATMSLRSGRTSAANLSSCSVRRS